MAGGSHLLVSQVLSNILFVEQWLPYSHLFLTEILSLYKQRWEIRGEAPEGRNKLILICVILITKVAISIPSGIFNKLCTFLEYNWMQNKFLCTTIKFRLVVCLNFIVC